LSGFNDLLLAQRTAGSGIVTGRLPYQIAADDRKIVTENPDYKSELDPKAFSARERRKNIAEQLR
jgi:hypothetical protein